MAARSDADLRLLVATANVLTTLPRRGGKEEEAGVAVSGRVAALTGQFRRAGVHAVGIQESRPRCEQRVVVNDFLIVGGWLPRRGFMGRSSGWASAARYRSSGGTVA